MYVDVGVGVDGVDLSEVHQNIHMICHIPRMRYGSV